MTGMLQLLDIVIGGHLKHTLDVHVVNGCRKHEMTSTGCLRSATLMEMCWWIVTPWQCILQDMIVKSFKVEDGCLLGCSAM
jgi:hypothetical protein